MAKRRRKAASGDEVRHGVEATLYQSFALTLEGSALDFVIRAGGRKLGTLGIGKGSMTWKGRRDKRALPLGWTQFVGLMERERQDRRSRRG